MKRNVVFAVVLLGCGAVFGQIKHKFLLLDEAGRAVLLIDQFNLNSRPDKRGSFVDFCAVFRNNSGCQAIPRLQKK